MPQTKKIFDIFPPKPQTIFKKKEPKPLFETKPTREKTAWGKKFLTSLLTILFLAAIFSYFTLSKAEIEIWPETQTLNFQQKITIDKEINQADLQNKTLPAELIEIEKTLAQEFPSSGKVLKENRAEGVIRVYNAYSTSLQVLIANTRFVSTEGKLFKSIKRVTIPGGKYEKGKLQPSYLDVEVKAAEAGEEYNIGPSTFSIPGFAGTARYTAFYGKSFSVMTGGFRGEVSQVTQGDLDRAKDILVENLFKEIETVFKNKTSKDYVLLDKASEKEILEASSLAKAGAELESFHFQVKAKLKALVFKESDLNLFTKDYILSQTPEDKKIYEESLETNFSPEKIDLESGKIILNLEFSAKIYSDINQQSLKEALKGKSSAETKIFLENQHQIIKAEVKFWPFWVKRVPQDLEKIEIKLNLGVD